MSKEREALKMALECVEAWDRGCDRDTYWRDIEAAVTAIREALAEQPAQQEPVAIEYWLQDTMESGRWVTTDNMTKATAEKMLSGEYGDVYPQGRIVEPSPPQRKSLTDEELRDALRSCPHDTVENLRVRWLYAKDFARAIEAKLREKNNG